MNDRYSVGKEGLPHDAGKVETGWRAFFRSNRGDALGWALIFFWGAIVLLLEVTGSVASVSWWNGWSVFFIGFGAIVLAGAVISTRLKMWEKAGWNYIIGTILLGLGLSGIVGSACEGWIWVLVLVVIGAVILLGAFVKTPSDDSKATRGY